MRIDWWTLALQAVNVLILVWLLGRFLFRPVMDAIAARQASAQALLDEAREAKDRAQAEAQALKTQNDGFVADAAARRAEIRTEAEAERQRLLAQARLEADAVVEQGHAAIDAERGRVAAQWREKAASLAASMAGTLLARLPPEQTVQAMVDALKARYRLTGLQGKHGSRGL
jgi:F-type H+-transporting ATPase subunit b